MSRSALLTRSRLLRPAASLVLSLMMLAGLATACSDSPSEPIINSGSGDIYLPDAEADG